MDTGQISSTEKYAMDKFLTSASHRYSRCNYGYINSFDMRMVTSLVDYLERIKRGITRPRATGAYRVLRYTDACIYLYIPSGKEHLRSANTMVKK